MILSCYARRWDIEVTIKELKGGLHLGQMQVTKDKARVERSVVLPVLAYLLLLRLYGRSAASRREVSLFALKQRFTALYRRCVAGAVAAFGTKMEHKA